MKESKKLSKSDRKEIKDEIKDLEKQIKEYLELKEEYKKKSKDYEDRSKDCERLANLLKGDIEEYKKELELGLKEGIFSDRYKNDDSLREESSNYVYVVIDQDMHSYEAIQGIYDSFEKAIKCNAYANRGLTPNEKGEDGSLFIYREELNKELSSKY